MTEIKLQKWKRIILFFILSSILTVILLFVRLTIFSQTKGISGKETAILNPKYKDSLKEIRLKSSASELFFLKKNDLWWGSLEKDNLKITFPLNKSKIDSFINTLSSIRKVYHISDNVSLYKDYKLDSDAFYIQARDNSKAILLELFTGKLNYNASKISFRTGKSTSIYETDSDLIPYIHTEAEKWADMQLLPSYFSFKESEVLSCSIDGFAVYEGNRMEMESFIHKVLASRGSVILPSYINNMNEADCAHIILIETPQNNIRLFFLQNSSDDNYSVQSEINGQISGYSIEISLWTYNNLFENFKN